MIEEKVWLITGCSTGIGRATAERLLSKGRKVVATARKVESIKPLEQAYPEQALALALDVNEPKARADAISKTIAHFGRLDVLFNNAGYGLTGALEELSIEQVRDQMETNFFGLVALTQEAIPVMRGQGGGYVFNVASVAGLRGYQGVSAYCASKFAVVGLSESLAQELAPFNIKVCVIEPGPYKTDWAGRSMVKSDAIRSADESSPYSGLNAGIDKMFRKTDGCQPGDPLQIADALDFAVENDKVPVHIIFGDEAIQMYAEHKEQLGDDTYMLRLPHGKVAF